VLHPWEVLANILSSDKIADIVCDIGMYGCFLLLYASETNARTHTQAGDAQKRDIQLPRARA
jgi:hypothetical protein